MSENSGIDPSSLIKGQVAAQGLNAVLGLMPERVAKLIPGFNTLSGTSDALSTAFGKLAGETDKEISAIKELSNVLSNPSTAPAEAIKKLTSVLSDNVAQYQKLNKELMIAGRGEDSKAFIETTRQQAYAVANLGINMKSLIQANKDMLESYTGAVLGSVVQRERFDQSREALGKLITFNDKFGVSNQQSISIMNLFNNTLGGGAKAAQTFSDMLVIYAQRTGQNANKVFSEFNSNVDRFAVYSADKAIDKFEKMQIAAARVGQSVGNVIPMIEKFDDIESGFKTGGEINRVLGYLGGGFDAFKAMEATDDELQKMIYESISGVSAKFAEIGNDKSRRAMAKQIADSTGVDLKTVLGLLNKDSKLSEDLAAMGRMRPVREEFTEAGREAAAAKLTTAAEWGEVRDQFLEFGPLTAKLSDMIQANSRDLTMVTSRIVPALDKATAGAINNATSIEGLLGSARTLIEGVAKIPEEFAKQKAQDLQNSKRDIDTVVGKNTEYVEKVGGLLEHLKNNGIRANIEVDLKGNAAGATVREKPLPTVADAAASTSNWGSQQTPAQGMSTPR